MPNYEHYTADEFARDPLFMEWIYDNTTDAAAFWHAYIARRPDNMEELLEAEQALRMLAAIFGKERMVNEDESVPIKML